MPRGSMNELVAQPATSREPAPIADVEPPEMSDTTEFVLVDDDPPIPDQSDPDPPIADPAHLTATGAAFVDSDWCGLNILPVSRWELFAKDIVVSLDDETLPHDLECGGWSWSLLRGSEDWIVQLCDEVCEDIRQHPERQVVVDVLYGVAKATPSAK